MKFQSNRVLYIDHVSHDQIPDFLSKYSVSVVPYPESEYNQSRSPLKIIESAACRIPLVVSQTKAHQVFIDSGYVTPFNDGDAQSLATSIMEVYQGGPEVQTKTDKAFSFAKENTYEIRVKSVLMGI
jgi:glycosyltransferase involved in cell wall biosynthesis